MIITLLEYPHLKQRFSCGFGLPMGDSIHGIYRQFDDFFGSANMLMLLLWCTGCSWLQWLQWFWW